MRQNKIRDFSLADQDWIGLVIFKNFVDQDWIRFNFIREDWTRTKKFHSPLISDVDAMWYIKCSVVYKDAMWHINVRVVILILD